MEAKSDNTQGRSRKRPNTGKMESASVDLALQWMEHSRIFCQAIGTLRNKATYTDATLACEGSFYPVHKFVLSTCSEYFNAIFEWTPCVNPVIVINNMTCKELEALLDFIYIGEVSVKESQIPSVIRAAECLRIRGLAVFEGEGIKNEVAGTSSSAKRKRPSSAKSSGSSSSSAHKYQASSTNASQSKPAPQAKAASLSQATPVSQASTSQAASDSLTSATQLPSTSSLQQFNGPSAPEDHKPNEIQHSSRPHSSQAHMVPNPPSDDQAAASPAASPQSASQQLMVTHSSTVNHGSPPPLPPTPPLPATQTIAVNMPTHAGKLSATVKMEMGGAALPEEVSEEIPDLLETFVDMRPLYGSKPEQGDEVATFHAADVSENLYNFPEDMAEASVSHADPRLAMVEAAGVRVTEIPPAEAGLHKCPYCKRDCLKRDRLKRHIRTHTKEPWTCKYPGCDFDCPSYKSFLNHKKTAHDGKHKCQLCDFTSQRFDNIKRHMLIHSGELVHKCEYCDFSSKRLQNLTKHLKSKHKK